MRIFNPTYGLAPAEDQASQASASKPVDWRHDPIALFSNSKPNGRELLEGLKQHLGSFRNTDNIDFVFKDGAGQPAPAAIIDQVAGNYKGALLALAD